MTPAERDELLVRLDERTERLEKWTTAHVELHTRLAMAFVSAVVSTFLALGTVVISILR